MNSETYEEQLRQLSAGKLRLEPTEKNELKAVAMSGIPEIGEYIRALEDGYSRRGQEITKLTALLRTLPKRLRGADELPWSRGACSGYAIMAMRQAGIPVRDQICILDAMEEAMDLYSLDEAAAQLDERRAEDAGD